MTANDQKSDQPSARVLVREKDWAWPNDGRSGKEPENHREEVWVVGALAEEAFEPSYRVFLQEINSELVGYHRTGLEDLAREASVELCELSLTRFLSLPIHHLDRK